MTQFNVIPVGLDGLPVGAETARLPVVYERATQALSECTQIDECRDWANKAEAMASYFRQSKDDTLRKMAERIQARAIRRYGELLKQIPSGQGERTDKLHDADDMKLTRTQAATQAGISERQKVTALRIANIPDPEFDALIESDTPPTITKLAELGKQERKPPTITPLYDLEGINPEHFKKATYIIGSLTRLLEDCERADPADIARAVKEFEKPNLREKLARLESWLDRFIVNL